MLQILFWIKRIIRNIGPLCVSLIKKSNNVVGKKIYISGHNTITNHGIDNHDKDEGDDKEKIDDNNVDDDDDDYDDGGGGVDDGLGNYFDFDIDSDEGDFGGDNDDDDFDGDNDDDDDLMFIFNLHTSIILAIAKTYKQHNMELDVSLGKKYQVEVQEC